MSQKIKEKKGQPQGNKFTFIAMWLFGHMLAWGAFIPVVEIFNTFSFNDTFFFAIMAVIVGGITSFTQYVLIRRQFGRDIKSWIPASLFAWLLATLVIIQPIVDLDGSQVDITLQALALFIPAAIVQTFLLRKYIPQAWLWLLASVAGTTTFALPIAFDHGADWAVVAGYGLYASATALTLLWLFGMSGGAIATGG